MMVVNWHKPVAYLSSVIMHSRRRILIKVLSSQFMLAACILI